jgi:hypothetical protein
VAGCYITDNFLHPIEYQIISLVVKLFEEKETDCVGFSFIARKGLSFTGETHTCVLWKSKENYKLIDSNQEKYSKFLPDLIKAGFKLEMGYISGLEELYNSNSVNKRDCIDIAMKIILEIQSNKDKTTKAVYDLLHRMFNNDPRGNKLLQGILTLKDGLTITKLHSCNKKDRQIAYSVLSDLARMKVIESAKSEDSK